MSDKLTPLTVTVTEQGAPRVNTTGAYVLAREDRLAAVSIDLASKRCDVLSSEVSDAGIPQLFLIATQESLHLDASHPLSQYTVIELPGFAGWEVWLAEISRYTLRACLVKREEVRT